ncbi:ATP-binding protein [Oxalobacteraceae bacterium R-40]|uniref:histidine kinase n=1 Tax=Keguizhuia sedimenti TaxID=3064264 RepID=A0ABU1BNL7_9BURK|nr:ATP-binding protein [Oxalobacteraceae bacterium R-40]
MPSVENRLAWLKSGLFWRTFFLLAFLIAASMAAWVISFRTIERTPRANQIAAQVISLVTITRAALTHSAPDLRRELLFDLASNEGIRIYPREETDDVSPPSDAFLMPEVQTRVQEQLGDDTIFASRVNDNPGFWVSFNIDEDAYWLMLDRSRVVGPSGVQWLGWATVTLLLSLIGAVFISRLINQPLARLTAATRAIAKGRQPEPLPEKGPNEIKDANRSFNQMVADLNQIESDRAIILAGISHDLRTPISRMLLEVELAKLPEDARLGMQSDLAQMDAIIGQFLDYAKPTDKNRFNPIDISALLESVAHEAERIPDVRVQTDIAKNVKVLGIDLELRRVIQNLIENARRYGKTKGTDVAHIDLRGRIEDGRAIIEVADHGAGIPEGEIDHLLRPFTRMDSARSQANGSGLGLAIVNRIIKQHGGNLRLLNRKDGGLNVQISLAALKKGQDPA